MNQNTQSQKNELFKTIWSIANDLRGSVDGWDFKQYVLGILFYRYISENLTKYINQIEQEDDPNFDYAKLSDTELTSEGIKEIINEKGFFIPPSELFCNVVANSKNDENLNSTLDKIFKNIESSSKNADSEENVKGLFADLKFDDTKLGNSVVQRVEKLKKLLYAINDFKLDDFQDSDIDIFGDAYEYLMGMYASAAGKSGGEYFTPQEVSELLAKITTLGQDSINKVYDPCCGSGSLLLKFAKVLGKDNVKDGFWGQETNLTTYNLCRMNMFLHDVNYRSFYIAHGDTLTNPHHKDDEPFDAIVSNPPYSIKWEGDNNPLLINDPRFAPAGILAPKSKADLAFTMHMLSWLSPKGTCAIVEFPGVLYRGGAEQKIRKYLVDHNFVDCVIALPDNLFFGTSIATCILVLKKNKTNTIETLFIDASAEFIKGKQNKLGEQNIKNIIEAYKNRKEVPHFCALATMEQIAQNDYNLSVSRYVSKPDTREKIDIALLNSEIAQIVQRQDRLRKELDSIIAQLEEGVK